MRGFIGLVAWIVVVLLAVFAPRPARASEGTDGGALDGSALGPGVDTTARARWLETGPVIDASFGRTSCAPAMRACSFRHPLCVDACARAGSTVVSGDTVLAVVNAADRAWEAITGALGAPPPDGSPDGVWRVELGESVDGGGDAFLETRDVVSRFDRVSSVARVDRSLRPGCALDLALARAVARGSLWRAAPATDEASARAETEALARTATPCAFGHADDADDAEFQMHPERTIVEPLSPPYERGASLFFAWLDAMFGTRPAAIVIGSWALAPTRTPFDAAFWTAKPTGFDVLRTSLKDALWPGSTLDDVFTRFAVARALASPAARLAWHVPWPDHARRLASPEPVAPTGASYVLVDRDGAPPGTKLRVEAEWEDYGRLRWVAVKLDAAGRTLGELPIASVDRGTQASLTIESLDGVSRILIVCVNVGSTEHGFDPDQREWEPHGWLLTLEGE